MKVTKTKVIVLARYCDILEGKAKRDVSRCDGRLSGHHPEVGRVFVFDHNTLENIFRKYLEVFLHTRIMLIPKFKHIVTSLLVLFILF